MLSELDATAQAELVRRGDASPRELVDAAIARIERHDGDLGAVIVPLYERARAAAEAPPCADDAPFRGVPILIKDITATVAGAAQGNGLLPLRRAQRLAAADSHLVAALRRAGFIVIGKSNLSELAILPTAESPAFPPTRNPYHRTRSTGGSSGGAAAAVAAGLVPVAHANDTGGSIRIPASCCGLFGLKPSRGRVSLAPHYGDLHGGLVCEHVVARSVRDSAAILDVLAGAQPGDPYAAPPQRRPYAEELAGPERPLRIAYAMHYRGPDGRMVEAHPACCAAVDHAARLLASLGHRVEPAAPAALADPAWAARFLSVWVVGVTTDLAEASALLGRAIGEHEVEPLTWALAELGKLITAPAYADAWRWLHRAARRVAAFWTDYDLWLTPTLASPPLPLGALRSTADDPFAPLLAAGELAAFTTPFNATGQPACSLPLSRDAAGIPIGVQLVAASGREDLLFQISAQLERAQPFVHAATRS